jgi:hypothetical protein
VSDAPSIYARVRSDVCGMLSYDLNNLTPEQATRLDIATALRVLLDNQSGRLLRGESLDARELLMASDALSKILPPLREPPPANRVDPRKIMLDTYMGMRKRSELADPCSTYEGMKAEVERLRAELAALKAAGAPASGSGETIPRVSGASTATNVTLGGSNVVPLSRPPTATAPSGAVSPSPPPAPPKPAPAAPVTGIISDNVDEPWRPFVSRFEG